MAILENNSPLSFWIKGPFNLRSGWRANSLSGLLTVKGTVMREQGSLKGEGTHRGNLFAYVKLNKILQKINKIWYRRLIGVCT